MKKEATAFATSLLISALTFAQTAPQLGPGRKYSSIDRVKLEHLRAVHADRLRFASERQPVPLSTGYNDYRAIMHAHAEDASHTGGTRREMLAAAHKAGIQIIMLTDHVRPERDFIDDSWRGLYEGVLFIPGAEDRGFLSYPMKSIKGLKAESREQYTELVRSGGGDIFLCHVEERPDWPTDRLDGVEIYNHHTDIKDEGAFQLWLQGTLTDPVRLPQLVEALRQYPEEVFGAQQDYLTNVIAKWDRDSQQHRLTGVAANDCHHNQVFTVTAIDDKTVELGYITSKPTTTRVNADKVPGISALVNGRQPAELIARLDFDPYERSMTYVSTHIFSRELTEPAVRKALKDGHVFVAHDWLCDTTGFAFIAGRATKPVAISGDELKFQRGLVLTAATPLICLIKLIRNGDVIQTAKTKRMDFNVKKSGVYRVEAWLEVDGEQRPWIYSNPIYVR